VYPSALLQLTFAYCLQHELLFATSTEGEEVLPSSKASSVTSSFVGVGVGGGAGLGAEERSKTHSVFDPVFTENEKAVCTSLGMRVSDVNLMGYHRAVETGRTLFFMPHCPYRLYGNVLWTNWDILPNIFILGNRYEPPLVVVVVVLC
jgi:hypothetical protein